MGITNENFHNVRQLREQITAAEGTDESGKKKTICLKNGTSREVQWIMC